MDDFNQAIADDNVGWFDRHRNGSISTHIKSPEMVEALIKYSCHTINAIIAWSDNITVARYICEKYAAHIHFNNIYWMLKDNKFDIAEYLIVNGWFVTIESKKQMFEKKQVKLLYIVDPVLAEICNRWVANEQLICDYTEQLKDYEMFKCFYLLTTPLTN